MATLTAQFFQLLEADSKDIAFKQFDMIPLQFPELFYRRPSTKAYEDGLRIGALGTFREKHEGDPIAFDDPIQGTLVRTVHQAFGLGWRATWEMMMDDQHGIMNQMAADIGESARDHMERIAWDVENDGYTGTRHTGLEGEFLYSTTHTLLKTGGTASNMLAPPATLSQTSLEAAMTLMTTTTSDEGRQIRFQARKLLIHPNNQHNAYVLLNTEYKPNSGNNDRNTVASSRSGITVVGEVGVPYLSSTTRWSLHIEPSENSKGLTWNDRAPLEFDQANDALTKDRLHMGVYRASPMFREWRGHIGSGAL